ncbi:MAG: hypothetical protein JSR44_04320 [Spirochaetes bacterium]|nr:hypothetical protein [Spirochaetota bacterium]
MRDFLSLLIEHEVDFLIIGAFALARYGIPRGTGDLDIFINPTPTNVRRVLQALHDFGMSALKLTEHDLLSGDIIQLGFPPARIDLLTKLSGVTTEEILASREDGSLAGFKVAFLGKKIFIKNKRAVGRTKDLADIEAVEALEDK